MKEDNHPEEAFSIFEEAFKDLQESYLLQDLAPEQFVADTERIIRSSFPSQINFLETRGKLESQFGLLTHRPLEERIQEFINLATDFSNRLEAKEVSERICAYGIILSFADTVGFNVEPELVDA